jgi:hypothetical protein
MEIEREVITLSYDVMFDDANFDNDVHSIKIAELILRCASQIESISKDLFFENGGTGDRNKVRFDHDCLYKIMNDWHLENRTVYLNLVASKLTKPKYIEYKPFKHVLKNVTIGFDRTTKTKIREKRPTYSWNVAYQELKHDFMGSVEKCATIHNLLSIVATLYTLSIYYGNPTKEMAMRQTYMTYDDMFHSNSKLFRVTNAILSFHSIVMGDEYKKSEINSWLKKPLFIAKYTDFFAEKIRRQEGIKSVKLSRPDVDGQIEQFEEVEFEVVLNKGQEIYPKLEDEEWELLNLEM